MTTPTSRSVKMIFRNYNPHPVSYNDFAVGVDGGGYYRTYKLSSYKITKQFEGTRFQEMEASSAKREDEVQDLMRNAESSKRSTEEWYRQDKEKNLDEHGEWMTSSDYGSVWRPKLETGDEDWHPFSNGQWLYTDRGWFWESRDAFGRLTCHFGQCPMFVSSGRVRFGKCILSHEGEKPPGTSRLRVTPARQAGLQWTRCGDGVSVEVAGGPGVLEIEAAGDAIDIEDFTGEIQSLAEFRLHGFEIHFFER